MADAVEVLPTQQEESPLDGVLPFREGLKDPQPDPKGVANYKPCLSSALFDNTKHRLVKPADRLPEYLFGELDTSRLTRLYGWLWLFGRKGHVRTLHNQKAHSRTIVILEQADMHMLWEASRIYLKPLPRYLLSANFWKAHLVCKDPDRQCKENPSTTCPEHQLYGLALGLLHSYMQLMRYESDFAIAKEARLVPDDLDWITWVHITDQVLDRLHKLPLVNKRYEYGELRLDRVNLLMSIPFFQEGFSLLRGYYFPFTEYSQRFEHSLRFLFTVFVYCSIILAALQVGLGIDSFQEWGLFVRASEWSIYLVLGFMLLALIRIGLLLFLYGVSNAWATFKWIQSSRKAESHRKRTD